MENRTQPVLCLRPKTFSQSIPASTSWLLAACMEMRGKQDLWIRQKPELLQTLRERAIIQSAESSNRIEGVMVDADRLVPLLRRKSAPRDRSEQELLGYRSGLDWIFSRRRPVALTQRVLLHLHSLALPDAGDSGAFKTKDNEIIELLPRGGRRVRFRPTSAADTPRAIESLCGQFASDDLADVPRLLRVATAVFDFLCIHPFRDGNGRVSRLLTTLLMSAGQFEVVRFVSMERLIEQSKEDYYRVLGQCSQGWHEGRNEITPWWNYFLGIVHRAYKLFGEQVESARSNGGKQEVIEAAVLGRVDSFTLSELRSVLPNVSLPMIKVVLQRMQRAGKIKLQGRGRGAVWRII